MRNKEDKYYIEKALNEINIIIKYLNNKSYEEFVSDEQLIDSIMFRLIQLGEHIKKMSLEFKDDYPNIPWGKILGFRNGIVHEYGMTNYMTVYKIISQDILDLKILFESMVN